MRHVAGFASHILIILGITIIGFSTPSEPLYYQKVQAYEPITIPTITTIIEQKAEESFDYTEPNCSCVIYLQNKGLDIKQNAEDIRPNFTGTTTPNRGDVVLLRYPKASHVAYIEAIYPGGMWISEANYKECERTERLIKWNDKAIRGYLRI